MHYMVKTFFTAFIVFGVCLIFTDEKKPVSTRKDLKDNLIAIIGLLSFSTMIVTGIGSIWVLL